MRKHIREGVETLLLVTLLVAVWRLLLERQSRAHNTSSSQVQPQVSSLSPAKLNSTSLQDERSQGDTISNSHGQLGSLLSLRQGSVAKKSP